jgi:hypothetical protein
MPRDFLRRATQGKLIDRRDAEKRKDPTKNPKHRPLPQQLMKFFRKIGEDDVTP